MTIAYYLDRTNLAIRPIEVNGKGPDGDILFSFLGNGGIRGAGGLCDGAAIFPSMAEAHAEMLKRLPAGFKDLEEPKTEEEELEED